MIGRMLVNTNLPYSARILCVTFGFAVVRVGGCLKFIHESDIKDKGGYYEYAEKTDGNHKRPKLTGKGIPRIHKGV